MAYEAQIAQSLEYLASDDAVRSLAADPYWPKWHSPWWHMLVLHEMDETQRIPDRAVAACIEALNRFRVKIFPVEPDEMPADADPQRDTACHCQLGSIYQVLAARGIDVDAELPWIRPWFLRYQMADGGFNCDTAAYRTADECPSSMVGMIAVFEAVLLHTPRPWTEAEMAFLDGGAAFLIGRKLMRGSDTRHNAAERVSAQHWLQPCFPRLYFYDVLRGLNALLIWAQKRATRAALPVAHDVAHHLHARFPDGAIRKERLAYAGVGTVPERGAAQPRQRLPATLFPLLSAVSVVGEVSPYLSRQWAHAQERLHALDGPQAP